jgi:hypothetical protein
MNSEKNIIDDNVLLKWAIYGSRELLTQIYQDDEFYNSARLALTDEKDAKKIVLYGFTREVLKCCSSILQKSDYFKSDDKNPDEPKGTSWINTLMLESFADEQHLWIRKLIEILINQINFSETDNDLIYRAYLSLENLELFLGKQYNYKTYFAIPYLNIDSTIVLFRERVEKDIKGFKNNPVWFIHQSNYKRNYLPIFSSTKFRFDRALKTAKSIEKMILGQTYEAFYSIASNSMHGKAGSAENEINESKIRFNTNLMLLLSYAILNRSCQLLGITNDYVYKLDSSLINNTTAKLLSKNSKEIPIGSIALAYGRLVEILDKIASDFGYISYKVRHLAKPLKPEIIEEYFPSQYITPLFQKADVRKYLSDLKNTEPSQQIDNFNIEDNEEELFEQIKKYFIELSNNDELLEFLKSLQDNSDKK